MLDGASQPSWPSRNPLAFSSVVSYAKRTRALCRDNVQHRLAPAAMIFPLVPLANGMNHPGDTAVVWNIGTGRLSIRVLRSFSTNAALSSDATE